MIHTLMVAYNQTLYVSTILIRLPSRRFETSALIALYASSTPTDGEKIWLPKVDQLANWCTGLLLSFV